MNRARMELLLDVLKNIPPEKFDMTHWALGEGCGTVACAAGWLALDPRAQAEGLSLRLTLSSNSKTVVFDGHTASRALQIFLGIRLFEAEWLFYPVSYSNEMRKAGITPAQVARRVRKVIKDNERN